MKATCCGTPTTILYEANGVADNYINADVTPGVLSNYSAAYAHHSTAGCANSTDAQNACE